MGTQTINVGNISITIPADYQQVDTLPGDPENSVPLMTKTDNALCLILIYPIAADDAMPRDKDIIIDGVRQALGDRQGLIQVDVSADYAYSIVKTLQDPSNVQYTLTFQKHYPEGVLHVQGYFDETGPTGIRDAIVYELFSRQHPESSSDESSPGWIQDPYDPEYQQGALMNVSEQEIYDHYFPGSPLSKCRELVRILASGYSAETVADPLPIPHE